MTILTYKEWKKLPHEERCTRYKEMSDKDRFIARTTEIYDETNPIPQRKTPFVIRTIKRPPKEEYKKDWEYTYNRIYKSGRMSEEDYNKNMNDLEYRVSHYEEWPFPCDITFKEYIYEQ